MERGFVAQIAAASGMPAIATAKGRMAIRARPDTASGRPTATLRIGPVRK
jgi:hypothetical protein